MRSRSRRKTRASRAPSRPRSRAATRHTTPKRLLKVLDGGDGAYRDIALINTGAALVIAGKAASLKDGVGLGDAAIRSGAARRTLDRLIAVSNA